MLGSADRVSAIRAGWQETTGIVFIALASCASCTSRSAAPGVQTSVLAPSQAFTTIRAPVVVPPLSVSRHRPFIWIVPSGSTVQFCSAVFSQVDSCTGLPAAELSVASSMHIAATPEFCSLAPLSLPWLNIPDRMGPPGVGVAVDASGNMARSLW